MKHFQKLSDDDLLKEKNRYNDIVNGYQQSIDNYDIHYKDYLEAKRNGDTLIPIDHPHIIGNPIIWSNLNFSKETAYSSFKIIGFGHEHFETIKIDGYGEIYVLTKEGNRMVNTEQMEIFVRRKRQVELILRGRKKEKEKNKTKHHIELKRDKSVSWKINRYTGEGTRKVGDYSFDYKCEKVDKLF